MKPRSVEQLKPLTSVRGIAALWVYLSHCQYLKSSNAFVTSLVGNGFYGVDVFFILSGFIMSHVHLVDFLSAEKLRKNYAHFLLLRIARIYPLHFITLLVVLLFHATNIFGWPDHDSIGAFFAHLVLLQATGWWAEVQTWNLVTWSISVEWILYLVFPVFAWAVGTRPRNIPLNMLLVAGPILAWIEYFRVTGVDMSWMHEAGRNLVRGGLDFTIGVGLYNFFRWKFLKNLPWDVIAILCCIGVLLAVWGQSEHMQISSVVYVALFTVLIYALANLKGFAQRIFSNRPVVYLGKVSYSLYMWHWILVVFVAFHCMDWWENHSFFSWQFVLQTAVLIGISGLSFRFIEAPTRRWIRRWLHEGPAV